MTRKCSKGEDPYFQFSCTHCRIVQGTTSVYGRKVLWNGDTSPSMVKTWHFFLCGCLNSVGLLTCFCTSSLRGMWLYSLERENATGFHTGMNLESADAVQSKCPGLILWRLNLLLLLNFSDSTRILLPPFYFFWIMSSVCKCRSRYWI